jgi:UDP-GlcNAc:undecaprenyl-phosphate GlcNAc-1-phosphate transferase
MLIGLIVAAVAIHSTIKEQAAIALVVPIAVCAIPIIDAGAAMIRRITTGQSVFTADRGHLHHSLLLRGLSVGWTVAAITALTVVTCMGAFVSYYTGKDYYALAAAVGVFVSLAGFRIFGHAEAMLIASHVGGAMRSTLLGGRGGGAEGTEKSVKLQGERKWEKVWLGLREAAPVYNLAALKLTVNIPHLHESFYGAWKSSQFDGSSDTWHLTIPLSLDGQQIGKISVTGMTGGSLALQEIQQVLDFLEPLESEIERFLDVDFKERPSVGADLASSLVDAGETRGKVASSAEARV